jgi:hypothetical protein
VDVELLLVPDGPGSEEASHLLRTALDDIGSGGTPFRVSVNDTDDVARGRRLAGSPAFLVNGIDLFASSEPRGSVACRVYPTLDGPRNLPALLDLRQAVEEQAASTAAT